jgi:hypothetical protein
MSTVHLGVLFVVVGMGAAEAPIEVEILQAAVTSVIMGEFILVTALASMSDAMELMVVVVAGSSMVFRRTG